MSSSSVCARRAHRHQKGTSAQQFPPPLTQPHTTKHTLHAAAGVQLKKLLVESQFGPITNDVGNIWRCGGREAGKGPS
jgi:hypothetical protein